jgi:hypothetical protein
MVIHIKRNSKAESTPGGGMKVFMPMSDIYRIVSFVLVVLMVATGSLIFSTSSVFAVPAIAGGSLPNGQPNVYYSAALTAAPLVCPCSWAITGGTLPPGLVLNPGSGIISGMPTNSGTFSFLARVTDTTGPSAQQSFVISIIPQPLSITTTGLPQGKELIYYTASLSANGGTPPYVWNLTGGLIPSGVSLDPTNGFISGTPARGTAGTFTFTINVTDNSTPSLSTQMSYTMYIEKGSFQSTISIDTGLKSGTTKVIADGVTVGSLRGGELTTISLNLGTARTITVDPSVSDPVDPGIRYRAKEQAITVSENQPNAQFTYYPEYHVTIVAEPSINVQTSGSGWYAQGTPVTLVAATNSEGNTGVMYKFASWQLPNNQKSASEQVNFIVDSPATITARYDTYYRLTTETTYGEVTGSGWYKAGTDAHWQVVNDKVPMNGIIGLFQGKFRAVNPSGDELMDGPKTITVSWEQDYTLPYVLIPIASIIMILIIYGLYRLFRGQPRLQPQPVAATGPGIPPPSPYLGLPYRVPYLPPPRPIPQHTTTVVMIGDKGSDQKQLPSATKEQLKEKFSELLDKYEAEIRSSTEAKQLPGTIAIPGEKQIQPPKPVLPPLQPPEYDTETVKKQIEPRHCPYKAKKLLRTVAGGWKKSDADTVDLPATDGKNVKAGKALLIIWSRDIYYEWEVVTCELPSGHQGKHQGAKSRVYSLLNTVSEKKIYTPEDEKQQPPASHYSNGLPELDMSVEEIVAASELPLEIIK